MKVLIFNTSCHSGSTGKIAYNLLQYLRDNGHEAKLLYRGPYEREGDINDVDCIPLTTKIRAKYAGLMTRLTGYSGYYCNKATKKAIRIIESFKPDIIQFYNPQGYYINYYDMLEYIKLHNMRLVITMIDEHSYVGKCTSRHGCEKYKTQCDKCPQFKVYPESLFFDRSNYLFNLKGNIYKGFKNLLFIAPQWVKETSEKSAIMKEQKVIALDEPINYEGVYYPRDTKKMRINLGIPQENKVILGIGPMSNKGKGGEYFMKLAEMLKDHKELSFVFVNYDNNDYVPDNVITTPRLETNDEVAEYFSMGDIFVSTTYIDTQADTCLEALGCGTPLCGFAERGTPYIATPPYGVFTKTFDMDALARVVLDCPKKTKEISDACVEYAHSRFDKKAVYSKTIDIYKQLLNQK